MPPPIFPVHLFNPASVKIKPRARVIDGGTSLVGDKDVISADGGGRWYGSYSGITIRDAQLERWMTQWDSYFMGGSRVFLAPCLSLRTAPRPVIGNRPLRPSDIVTNDPVFPTTTSFATPYIIATIVDNVTIGATSLTINILKGARLQGGETFSVGNRAYVIERVTARSDQIATCIVSPPVRAVISAGSSANFEWPVVQARIDTGQDLAPELSFGLGQVSISWVEDFSNAV